MTLFDTGSSLPAKILCDREICDDRKYICDKINEQYFFDLFPTKFNNTSSTKIVASTQI